MKTILPTGSHRRVLEYAVRLTRGPVLECGVGYFSTPLLHALCCPGRRLVSLEPDPRWAALFSGFARDGHVIEVIDGATESWLEAAERHAEEGLSVVLIDQNADTWVNRIAVAERLADRAEILVVHDINRRSRGVPEGLRKLFGRIGHVRVFPGEGRNFGTAAASQTVDLNQWPEMPG